MPGNGSRYDESSLRPLFLYEEWSCTIRQPCGVLTQIVVNQPVRFGRPAPLRMNWPVAIA